MVKRKRKKTITSKKYIGKYKGSNTWHRISACSEAEAKGKMLKGTRYFYRQVSIKKYKQKR